MTIFVGTSFFRLEIPEKGGSVLFISLITGEVQNCSPFLKQILQVQDKSRCFPVKPVQNLK